GGGVVKDFLADVGSTVEKVRGAGDEFAPIADELADALEGLNETTDWVMANGLEDVRHALAAATPYLRQFGIVTGGWLLAESAVEAKALLDDGGSDFSTEFLEAKLTTA